MGCSISQHIETGVVLALSIWGHSYSHPVRSLFQWSLVLGYLDALPCRAMRSPQRTSTYTHCTQIRLWDARYRYCGYRSIQAEAERKNRKGSVTLVLLPLKYENDDSVMIQVYATSAHSLHPNQHSRTARINNLSR